MSDLLRRNQAPISDEAWNQLDAQASRALRQQLIARTFVDFQGPHGWEYGAVNLGRLESDEQTTSEGVRWALRKVQPLIEVRIPFALSRMELDNIERGCSDSDLKPLLHAVEQAGQFEDRAVIQGFPDGGIQGILPSATIPSLSISDDPLGYPAAVAEATRRLQDNGVEGPFALLLSEEHYASLLGAGTQGYPPHRLLRDALEEGDIFSTPSLEGGAVVSRRGGDFELTVGADYSLGYRESNKNEVGFFIAESFTFRVLEPAAVVELKIQAKQEHERKTP